MIPRSRYPDERSHAEPEHLDDEYVAGYDAKAQLAAVDAPEAARVVGVDPSPAMLEGFAEVVDAWEPDVAWLSGRSGYRGAGRP